MSPIRLGFAGVGWLGESLIKELTAVPELELAGVQDARPELARAISTKYGGVWWGQEFDALLSAPGVEVVVICTPNALHVPQAVQALRAGKDVLVQKPLALSLADARLVLDLARATGRLLFVDYTYRFLATVEALRDALPSIGRVRAVRAEFHNIYGPGAEKAWFFDRARSGGGALLDLGVHLLDLALWLFEPEQLSLEHARLEQGPIERQADLRVRLDDGVPFDLAVSWNAPLPQTRIAFEIDAERGQLRWENVAGSFFRFRAVQSGSVLIERETTLRSDTLRAFVRALERGVAPKVDARAYELLDRAYGRGV